MKSRLFGLRETKKSVITGERRCSHKELDEVVGGGQCGDFSCAASSGYGCGARAGSAKPARSRRTRSFLAQVVCAEEGRRREDQAFSTGYRPQFYVRTMDVTGNITLPEGVEMVMPGDNVNLTQWSDCAGGVEQGSKFAIREGRLDRRLWRRTKYWNKSWLNKRFASGLKAYDHPVLDQSATDC